MPALYNEIEPYAASWLEALISGGHIAHGRVERRSVQVLRPVDVAAAEQAHFFAGIGVWSHALRTAGWPDDVPVWTGSCPCQPFSTAGKRAGRSDERHLWPWWFRLIAKCRPPIVFGEQVASPDGRAWLDTVLADLERVGFAVAAADLCAAGIGAPHLRQRLFFVAIASEQRRKALVGIVRARESHHGGRGQAGSLAHSAGDGSGSRRAGEAGGRSTLEPHRHGAVGRAQGAALGDPGGARNGRDTGAVSREEGARAGEGREPRRVADVAVDAGSARDLGVTAGARRQGISLGGSAYTRHEGPSAERAGPVGGFWGGADWLACRDGKARPVEPGTFPLAHGFAGRVGLVRTRIEGGSEIQETHWYSRAGALKGYGNAIVGPLAAEFIASVMEIL